MYTLFIFKCYGTLCNVIQCTLYTECIAAAIAKRIDAAERTPALSEEGRLEHPVEPRLHKPRGRYPLQIFFPPAKISSVAKRLNIRDFPQANFITYSN